MDWFLYDNGLRHERVQLVREEKYSEPYRTSKMKLFAKIFND